MIYLRPRINPVSKIVSVKKTIHQRETKMASAFTYIHCKGRITMKKNTQVYPSKIYTMTTPNPQGMLNDPRPVEDAIPSEATINRKMENNNENQQLYGAPPLSTTYRR